MVVSARQKVCFVASHHDKTDDKGLEPLVQIDVVLAKLVRELEWDCGNSRGNDAKDACRLTNDQRCGD